MIGHNNLGIEWVPIAGFKGRCTVYSDLYDVVLSVIFAKNEILLWLIDDIDETGITQLFMTSRASSLMEMFGMRTSPIARCDAAISSSFRRASSA